MALLNRKTDFYDHTADQFIFYSERIVELGRSIGIHIKAFNNSQLLHFRSLTEEKRNEVIFGIKSYVHICEVTLASGKELSDSQSLTWFALKEMGLRFNSEIFSYISNTDVIEVYTHDHIQIFRNFRFLELISYTLEDIFCRPWTELFDHKQPEKFAKILSTAKMFQTKQITTTVSLSDHGSYFINETSSEKKYNYDYTIKYASPILDRNACPFGYLLIENAKVVSEEVQKPITVELNNYIS